MTDNPSPHREPSSASSQPAEEPLAFAHRIDPTHSWDDLPLPLDAKAAFRDLCQRLTRDRRASASPGSPRPSSPAHGVSVLFTGPSGAGKTIAAALLAREIGLTPYRIDTAAVVSKYIGETEKNLDRVFASASPGSLLFFDEADALFGKRSEVRDSHDRYANIEINYFLQKAEAFGGVVILAAHLKQNLDPAFLRRFAFTLDFPARDEGE